MLADRKCTECHYSEEDLIEHYSTEAILICPRCHKLKYTRAISLCSFDMNGHGAMSMLLEKNRETSAAGGGNNSIGSF